MSCNVPGFPVGPWGLLLLVGSPWPVLGFWCGWVPVAGSGLSAPVGPGGRFWAWPRPWEPNGRGNPGTIIDVLMRRLNGYDIHIRSHLAQDACVVLLTVLRYATMPK